MSSSDPFADRPHQLDVPSLRDIQSVTFQLADSLRNLDFYRTSDEKMNQQHRQASIREFWQDAKQCAIRLARLLDDGKATAFPIWVFEIDSNGEQIARANDTLVAVILSDIWQNVTWIARGERVSSRIDVMYGMAAISERLRRNARKLSAVLRTTARGL